MSDSVTLEIAWMWKCPSCDYINFERGESFPAEEIAPYALGDNASADEVQEWTESGEFVSRPENVTCADCDRTYIVEADDADK